MKIIRSLFGIILLAAIIGAAMLYDTHREAVARRQTVKDAVFDLLKAHTRKLEEERLLLEQDEIRLKRDRVQAKREAIPRYTALKFYGAISLVASACVSLFVYAALRGKAEVITASVHDAKIGESVFPLHIREIKSGRYAQQLLALTNAENLKQSNAGFEKAMEIYATLADVQTQQFRALKGHVQYPISQIETPYPAALPVPPVPTFRELLNQERIGPGKPLIYGFQKQTGAPETGPLKEQYSIFTLGLPGFGKTTHTAFFIAQAVLAERAAFDVLDLQYPDEESLGYALGSLVQTPYVTLCENPYLVNDILDDYERELDERKFRDKDSYAPKVLTVDEHEIWVKNVPRLAQVEGRIIKEGRKLKLFVLLTSKSAKASNMGGDSDIKNQCTTTYVFKAKPPVAQTFFRDKEKELLVKQLKEPGECVFTDRKDNSSIVKIPLALRADMDLVTQRVVNGALNIDSTPPPVEPCIDLFVEPPNGEKSAAFELIESINLLLKSKVMTLTELSQQVKVDPSYLSRGLRGKASLSDTVKDRLSEVLKKRQENVIPFRRDVS